MMGPRSMGAGTHSDGAPRAAGPSRQRQRTYDSYNDEDNDHNEHPTETKRAPPLTPAQRLIERYERMSTPPPLPHTTTPGSCAGAGAAHATTRAKSTRRRQYVYDYRHTGDGEDDHNGSGPGGGGGGGGGWNGKRLGYMKKDRSPIRQSLKNLFSVLKKGAGGLTKLGHHGHHHHGHHQQHGRGEEKDGMLGVPGRPGGVGGDRNEVGLQADEDLKSETPYPSHVQNPPRPPRKKMTGPLLYLSRQSPLCYADSSSSSSSEDIPTTDVNASHRRPDPTETPAAAAAASYTWAWTTCSVTLDAEGGKLVVSCFTGDLELYVREVALVRCVDIRSLSAAQLEVGMKDEGVVVSSDAAAAVGDGRDRDRDRDMKVFEMSFSDGRGKERFAAKSVRERAGWISAIWDAILPNQDFDEQCGPSSFGDAKDRTLGPPKHDDDDRNFESRKVPVESPTPTPLPKLSSLLSHDSQYSPPPLPTKAHSITSSDPVRNTIPGAAASLTLPTIAPLVLPHKKHPDLHLDLSEFAGPISPPSIYPPTMSESMVSPGATRSQNGSEVVISPSLYGQAEARQAENEQRPPTSPLLPPTTRTTTTGSSSRPASIFVASPVSIGSYLGPISGSAPNSPSIRNLSQLSVVRQRLAQIQRNHSEISAGERSRYSAYTHASAPATPTSSAHLRLRGQTTRRGGGVGTPQAASPISPIGSGWSKSEAVFHRKGKMDSKDDDLRRSDVVAPVASSPSRYRKDDGGGTPQAASPISPIGSGWSKSEAVFHRKGKSKDDDSRGKAAESSSSRYRKDDGDEHPVFGERQEKQEERAAQRKVSYHKTRPRANSHRDDEDDDGLSPTRPGKHTSPTPTSSLAPSKDDIRRLTKEVTGIKNVLGGESGCSTVHEMVFSLEQRMRGEKKELRAIKDEIKVLGDRVSEAIATNVDVAARIEAVNGANAQAGGSNNDAATVVRQVTDPRSITEAASRKDDQAIILSSLNEVKDRLSVEFPALAGKIQDIKDTQLLMQKERERESKEKVVTMNNVARSSSLDSNVGSDSRASADQKLLLEKLEEIRSLCQVPTPAAPTPSVPAPVASSSREESVDLKENLAKILSLIQEDSNKQTLLSQQQGDSVRYLNELNSWLEAFVNDGTSQIQGISNNIERLCNEIGCISTSNNGRSSNNSQPNLVHDIRQLVAGMKARDQNFASLQAAVHSLLEVLTASQAQHGADSQAIAGLMDRQRHDQEAMFRAFTNEISGEIKGERLRFVDAMKEATAINVQLHVEQFKQELSKEVMSMTEEVGRLHREKQVVENQISDLFSFYSKHKKAEMPLQVIPPNTGMSIRHTVQEVPRANIPRSNRQRALPAYPRQQ